MARNLIPKNDAEANVLTYRAMEEPLRKAYKRYADKTAKGMLSKIGNILTAAGYDGTNKATVINRPADPSTLRALEQMIEGVSDDRTRRKLYSKLYGQIGGANLTVRNAIRDVTEFGRYQDIDKLYSAGRRPLMDVAREGMLRGEFMVQKQVGLAWSMQSPGIQQVESFLSKRWTHNDVVAYMQPLSKIVEDQVSQGLLLGEHPSKIAERIKNVEPINDVRANRNARTLTNAVANDAHTQSYKKHGVKRYEFVATFDERTCPVCGSLDGKTFPLDSKSVGTNYPPLHPNCRCTTVAALSKELKQKLYDDFEVKTKDGEVKRINANTTYDDWIKGNIKPTPVPPAPSEKKKKAIAKKVTAESYPPAFTRTKAEAKNTQMLADFIERQDNADPTVKNLYANMAKMENIESTGRGFKVTHGRDSGVVQYRYRYSDGNLTDAKIAYPKMEDADDIRAVNVTLHEQGHLMDMFARSDPDKPEGWFSTSRKELVDTFNATSMDIGKDTQDMFDKYHADYDAEKSKIWAEARKKNEALHEKYKAQEIKYDDYMKEVKKINKQASEAADEYARTWGGGGVDMVEDIYDALSGGKYRDTGKVKYGHGGKYYRNKDQRIHETFANYAALSITRPDLIEMLKKDKPDLCKELDATMQAMNKKWGLNNG